MQRFSSTFTNLNGRGPTPSNIVQIASIARSQGLVKSYCRCSPGHGRWAILQLMCSQAQRKFQEELSQKKFTKPWDRAIDALCRLEVLWFRILSIFQNLIIPIPAKIDFCPVLELIPGTQFQNWIFYHGYDSDSDSRKNRNHNTSNWDPISVYWWSSVAKTYARDASSSEARREMWTPLHWRNRNEQDEQGEGGGQALPF